MKFVFYNFSTNDLDRKQNIKFKAFFDAAKLNNINIEQLNQEKLEKIDVKNEPTCLFIFIDSLQTLDSTSSYENISKHLFSEIIVVCEAHLYPEILEKKQTLPIDYLLKVPIDESLVNLLFKIILTDKSNSAQLMLDYQRSIFDKIYEIERTISETLDKSKNITLEEVRKKYHKLAGTLGSFGFEDAGNYCKKLDKEIPSKTKDGSTEKYLLDTFKEFTSKLQNFSPVQLEVLQKGSQESARKGPFGYSCDLFFIEDDVDILNLAKNEALKHGFTIEVESNFQNASEKIVSNQFCPRMIFFDLESSKEAITGFDLINKFTSENPLAERSIISILTSHDDIETRLKTKNLPINFFLAKPLKFAKLFEILQSPFKESLREEKYVLMLDEDQSFLEKLTTIFKTSNIIFLPSSNKDHFFEILNYHYPESVIINIENPSLKGLDIMSSMKNDPRFSDIYKIALTESYENRENSKNQIDYYLKKSADLNVFKETLNCFFAKQQILSSLKNQDLYYGLYQKKILIDSFDTICITNNEFSIGYFFFDPSKLQPDEVKQSYDFFCSCLSSYFSKKELIGNYRKNDFLIISTDFSSNQLKRIMIEFLNFYKEKTQKDEINILGTVAVYPYHGKTLNTLVSFAKMQILNQKPGDVSIGSTAVVAYSKEKTNNIILILCDNPILTETFNYVFTVRQFRPFFLDMGKDATKWVKDHLFHESAKLILIDSDLKTENSFVITEKLSSIVGKKTPIIYLSSSSKETENLELMSNSFIISINKPFNINSLITKIEELILK